MSYCVNCGVELDDSAKKCALCGTPVINPNKSGAENFDLPYPDKIVLPATKVKRYRATIATLVMLLPTLVCMPVNYFITPESRWAVYIAATSVLLWIFFVTPFFMRRTVPNSPYLALTLDGLITLAYIYVFYHIHSSGTWFFRIAVPMVVAFMIFGYLAIAYFKKKSGSKIRATAFVLFLIALYAAATECIFLISMPNPVVTCISIVVFVSTAIMSVFLRFASDNKQFRAWVTRKFFVE